MTNIEKIDEKFAKGVLMRLIQLRTEGRGNKLMQLLETLGDDELSYPEFYDIAVGNANVAWARNDDLIREKEKW